MTTWQKRARLGIAIFGIVVAVVVYLSIGTRQTAPRQAPIAPLDAKLSSSSGSGSVEQSRRAQRDFEITFEKIERYVDGSTKVTKPKITVQKSDGRTFVVTADEATTGTNEKQKEFMGHVKLAASDGFEMTTDRATHNEDEGVVRAPGAVDFKKGHMSGHGTNGTFDQNNDVLTIAENAAVTVRDEEGHPTTDFTSGSAVLDRMQHMLTLDKQVHVVRGAQITDTDHSTARLSENNEIITHLELRGQARVTGASAVRSMSARDIDMDYSEDGRTLERVTMKGQAEVTPTTQGEGPARSIAAEESLDLQFAPDGSLLSVTGRKDTRLDLPPSKDSPGGRITSQAIDATGQEGRGLTEARFTDEVEYREPGRANGSPRTVRARTLTASLADDAISDAVFKERVVFEEKDLNASAPEVRYQPSKNAIELVGPDNAPPASHVAIDQIEIDARKINVALDTRKIAATQVKTTLRPKPTAPRGSDGRASGTQSMPGLLKQGEAANVNADALEYTSASGVATYSGNARLFQGNTSISGNVITVDREKGDLSATGSARSTLDLDGGRTTGSGEEIRYVDSTRTVTYSVPPVPPTRGRGVVPAGAVSGGRANPGPAPAPVPARARAQVKGPQGDLSAERIQIVLAQPDNRMDRLEAFTRVRLEIDTKKANGDRLTYHSEDERYVMSGTGATQVTVVVTTPATPTAPQTCRETAGRSLTFTKSTESVDVDGKEETRILTRNISCQNAALR
ncbi:MAG TPA: LPS export ABC transporter periplasmic protein LptC [Vicinamibacterales bacterium]